MTKVMAELIKKGTTRDLASEMMSVKEFSKIVKMENVHEFERQLEEQRPS
jgi:hypothetical protein